MKALKIITIALFFLAGSAAYATPLRYGRIININDKSIDIEYRDSDKSLFMNCSIKNAKCLKAKKPKQAKNDLIEINSAESADGKWTASYQSGKFETKYRTYELRNNATGELYSKTEETPYWDLVAEQTARYAFTKDSTKLFYLSDLDGTMSIYKVDLANLSGKELKGEKINLGVNEVMQFSVFDSETLYFVANTLENPYNWSLYKYSIATGNIANLASYMKYDEAIKKYKDYLLLVQTTTTGFSPILYNTGTGKFIKFTNSLFSTKTYTQGTDREVVHIEKMAGVLLKPKTTKTAASKNLVIWLHGGPYRQTSMRFHPFLGYGVYDNALEKLRDSGAYVLKLDYRGSLGLGRTYSENIKYNIGKGDVDDVVNAIAYMKSKFKIKDVYLMGNSYGGYLSLKTIAEKPEEIRGAVSIAGVTDWKALVEGLPSTIFKTQFDGLPTDANKLYYDQADIFGKLQNTKDKTISLIHGTSDRTIPKSQATALHDALALAGKNAKLVLYKGEDHVILKQKNTTDLCMQMFSTIGLGIKKSACLR